MLSTVSSSDASETNVALSGDGLRLYIQRSNDGLLVAERNSIEDTFAEAKGNNVLENINVWIGTAQHWSLDGASADGDTLYFTYGGQGIENAFSSTLDGSGAFQTPRRIEDLQDVQVNHVFPSWTGDELYLSCAGDLFVSSRADEEFQEPEPLLALNSAAHEDNVIVSADSRTLYWATNRTDGGAIGDSDIWKAVRTGPGASFSGPQNVTELNTALSEAPEALTEDECEIFLVRDNPDSGTLDIFVARRPLE